MAPEELIEGRDFYVDPDGLYVFTEAYLLARGACCRSGCRHCPYGYVRDTDLKKKPSRMTRDGSGN